MLTVRDESLEKEEVTVRMAERRLKFVVDELLEAAKLNQVCADLPDLDGDEEAIVEQLE